MIPEIAVTLLIFYLKKKLLWACATLLIMLEKGTGDKGDA